MIDVLMFKKDWRGFKAKTMVIFHPGVNLLVGDQGTGKSTILQCLVSHGGVQKAFWKKQTDQCMEHTRLFVSEQKRVFAHDFLHDSPQTSPGFDTMGMFKYGANIGHMWKSHGESTNLFLEMFKQLKDHYVILDEPDTGLSPRSALALVDTLSIMEKNGCQVICSVHHPWVIEAFELVYSTEHKDWMKSTDFLNEQMDPPPDKPSEQKGT